MEVNTKLEGIDLLGDHEDMMAADITLTVGKHIQKYRVQWDYSKDYIDVWAYNSRGNLITYLDAKPLRIPAPMYDNWEEHNEIWSPIGVVYGAAFTALDLGF